jgi:ribosome-associated protein
VKTKAKPKAKSKTPARKPAAKKKAVKAKKPARKISKPKSRKAVPAKKVVTAKKAGPTKTALRKAKRAAKAPVRVAAPPPHKPKWPPLVEAVLHKLDEAKAEQIVTVDLTGKSSVADTMVVASGRSNRHVNAIADQVVEELGKHGQKNIRIEGVPQCDWVLVDSGDVIVHVFRPEVRSFYNLEKLWSAHVPE